MHVGGMVVSGVAALGLLGFTSMGGLMALVDWVRARRQAMVTRQIALTEALDDRIGALVAPVVTKPLLGPWTVRIAVPPVGAALLARIIAVIDEAAAGREWAPPQSYRMILSVTTESLRTVREGRMGRAQRCWPGTPVAA